MLVERSASAVSLLPKKTFFSAATSTSPPFDLTVIVLKLTSSPAVTLTSPVPVTILLSLFPTTLKPLNTTLPASDTKPFVKFKSPLLFWSESAWIVMSPSPDVINQLSTLISFLACMLMPLSLPIGILGEPFVMLTLLSAVIMILSSPATAASPETSSLPVTETLPFSPMACKRITPSTIAKVPASITPSTFTAALMPLAANVTLPPLALILPKLLASTALSRTSPDMSAVTRPRESKTNVAFFEEVIATLLAFIVPLFWTLLLPMNAMSVAVIVPLLMIFPRSPKPPVAYVKLYLSCANSSLSTSIVVAVKPPKVTTLPVPPINIPFGFIRNNAPLELSVP